MVTVAKQRHTVQGPSGRMFADSSRRPEHARRPRRGRAGRTIPHGGKQWLCGGPERRLTRPGRSGVHGTFGDASVTAGRIPRSAQRSRTKHLINRCGTASPIRRMRGRRLAVLVLAWLLPRMRRRRRSPPPGTPLAVWAHPTDPAGSLVLGDRAQRHELPGRTRRSSALRCPTRPAGSAQVGVGCRMTVSPTSTFVTADPISCTQPAFSCPIV